MNLTITVDNRTQHLADKLVDIALKDGGGTFYFRPYDLRGMSFNDVGAYIVGGHLVPALVLPLIYHGDQLYALDTVYTRVGEWLTALPQGVQFVGSWVDDNKLYVDACSVTYSRAKAAEQAIKRNEIAVAYLTGNPSQPVIIETQAQISTYDGLAA